MSVSHTIRDRQAGAVEQLELCTPSSSLLPTAQAALSLHCLHRQVWLQATEVPGVCSWVKRESSLTNSAFHLAWPLTLQTCTLADHCLVMAT